MESFEGSDVTSDTRNGKWPLWQRLGAEFAVVVVGVLVALAVDAAREARDDRVREAAYVRQLQADLSATAEELTEAISVDLRAREGADRAIEAIDAPPLPPSDSLGAWTASATNSSASFYPTMGTVTALVESGELRLIRDEALRQQVLHYHSSVEGALRIVDAVDPHTWRAIERLGGMLSWAALLDPDEARRFPIDWSALARDRAFHAALYDLRLASSNRLFALRSLEASLQSLLEELNRSSR